MTRSPSPVTDEPFDAYVTRPLAARVVDAVAASRVSPNQLTLASAACGTLAGLAFWSGGSAAAVAGAVALFAAMVFDCSDGQLARRRGGGSKAGRILDGIADYWVSVAVHYGMLVHLGRTGVTLLGHTLDARERFLLVLAAGVTMAVSSASFDKHKQRYLAETRGVTLEAVGDVLADARRATSLLDRALLYVFAAYVRLVQGTGGPPPRPVRREPSGEELRGLRLRSMAGPSLHFVGICAAALLVPLVPAAFAFYCVLVIVAVNAYGASIRLLEARRGGLAPRAAS